MTSRDLDPPPLPPSFSAQVLEGDQVTIYPNGDEAAAMAVDLKVGVGIPAPMEAPPFAKHSLKNTGKGVLKLLFFEMKN